jgi:hypothetical protein
MPVPEGGAPESTDYFPRICTIFAQGKIEAENLGEIETCQKRQTTQH